MLQIRLVSSAIRMKSLITKIRKPFFICLFVPGKLPESRIHSKQGHELCGNRSMAILTERTKYFESKATDLIFA